LRLGLKCGGTPAERAARLFRTKGHEADMAAYRAAHPTDVAGQGRGKRKRGKVCKGGGATQEHPKSSSWAAQPAVAAAAPMDASAADTAVPMDMFAEDDNPGSKGFTERDQENIASSVAAAAHSGQRRLHGLGFS
jgi:hypothetical protein